MSKGGKGGPPRGSTDGRRKRGRVRSQLEGMRATVGHADLVPLPCYWGQPFEEEIDQWFSSLPPRTIHTFIDLATTFASQHTFTDLTATFVSQVVVNCVKKLDMIDLFDIKQTKGENVKKYLTQFNSTIVQVNDHNQKLFVKA
ncbi:hypothetical protein CR513_31904, partial [Mucuna pruriens]